MAQMVIEITGALVFASIICLKYMKYGWDLKLGKEIGVAIGCEGPCKEIMECLRITLLRNAIVAIVYVVFIIYVELVAGSFYKYCNERSKKQSQRNTKGFFHFS